LKCVCRGLPPLMGPSLHNRLPCVFHRLHTNDYLWQSWQAMALCRCRSGGHKVVALQIAQCLYSCAQSSSLTRRSPIKPAALRSTHVRIPLLCYVNMTYIRNQLLFIHLHLNGEQVAAQDMGNSTAFTSPGPDKSEMCGSSSTVNLSLPLPLLPPAFFFFPFPTLALLSVLFEASSSSRSSAAIFCARSCRSM
jgi:hypothetical protein